jgi:Flp pilus assembly protein TadG
VAKTETRAKGRWRNFLRGENGGITVEFALWVPVLLALLFLAIDASLLFSARANFWNLSRDTARVVSRHAMSVVEAESYARKLAKISDYQPEVRVRLNEQANTVTVTITAITAELMPFDVTGIVLGGTMSVQVTQSLEPI